MPQLFAVLRFRVGAAFCFALTEVPIYDVATRKLQHHDESKNAEHVHSLNSKAVCSLIVARQRS